MAHKAALLSKLQLKCEAFHRINCSMLSACRCLSFKFLTVFTFLKSDSIKVNMNMMNKREHLPDEPIYISPESTWTNPGVKTLD